MQPYLPDKISKMKVVGFLSLAVNMLNLTENQFKVNAINKIAQSGKVMEAVKKYGKPWDNVPPHSYAFKLL